MGNNNPSLIGDIATAGNLASGQNPVFTKDDFYQFYPNFKDVVPEYIVLELLTVADATVKQARWKSSWKIGMCNFIAHFSTLYLQAQDPASNPTATQIVNKAQSVGILTQKTVGDVSVAYSISAVTGGLDQWAMWNATSYGMQYATAARLFGMGGMYVY